MSKEKLTEMQEKEIAGMYRAGGDCICSRCGKKFYDHPMAKEPHLLGYDDKPFLHRLCNRDLVKL